MAIGFGIGKESDDPYFDAAVSKYVNESDVSRVAPSTMGSTGQRNRETVEALLKGSTLSFTNSNAALNEFSVSENEAYKNRFIWDMYKGVQIPYLDKLPSESISEFIRRPGKMAVNWLELVVGILTQLYNHPPQREFVGASKEDVDKIHNLYEEGSIDSAMGAVDEYTLLFGECLIRPILRKDKKTFDFAVIPRTDYELLIERCPITNQNEIMAVVLHTVYPITEKDGKTQRLVWEHDVWTEQSYGHFVDGKVVPVVIRGVDYDGRAENPYGRIPYVFATRNLNFATRFQQPDYHEMAIANAEFNNLLSISHYHMYFAGLPITTITDNIGSQTQFSLTPGYVLELMSGPNNIAKIEFQAPPDRIQSFKLHLQSTMQFLFQSKGINYSLSEGVKAGVSGIAIEVSMAPVLSEMEERAPVALDTEKRFYELFKTVAKVDAGTSLPEIEKLKVNYGFSMTIRSELDKRQELEFALGKGLIDKARALMRLYPYEYKTLEEALAAIPGKSDKNEGNEIGDEGKEQSLRVIPNDGSIPNDGRNQELQDDMGVGPNPNKDAVIDEGKEKGK